MSWLERWVSESVVVKAKMFCDGAWGGKKVSLRFRAEKWEVVKGQW